MDEQKSFQTMLGAQSERTAPSSDPISMRTMPGPRQEKHGFATNDLIMGRYMVLAELGRGGMGVVYKCLDTVGNVHVALKSLPPELSHNATEMEDIRENFQLVQSLNHPNIANVKQLERDPTTGMYYLIMECVEGESLRTWIRRRVKSGECSLASALPILTQIAEALDYAHEKKILHRDIKPGNVMIEADGTVKILDFGLASKIRTSLSYVSMAYKNVSGTGPYMSPEQWRGKRQDAPADQYALGILAYEMLAGHLPFESDDNAVLKQAILEETADPIPTLPKAINATLQRALAKDPSARFVTCSDFIATLQGKKVKATKSNVRTVSTSWKLIASILLVLLLGGAGTGYFLLEQRKQATLEAQQQEAARIAKEKRLAEEKQQAETLQQEANARREAEARLAEEKRLVEAQQAEAQRLAEKVQLEAQQQEEARVAEAQRQVEAQQQAEEAKLQRLQALYRLQTSVQRQQREILTKNYDRAQGFGKQLDLLTDNITSGERAMANQSVDLAETFFRDAETAAKWITTQAPLREKARSALAAVDTEKRIADQHHARRWASTLYTDAANRIQEGKTYFERAQFTEALKSINIGIALYDNAAKRAQSNHITSLLSDVNAARSRDDWKAVLRHANAILAIDSTHTDALRTKDEATKALLPKLTIVATVNGDPVPATITFSDNPPQETHDNIMTGFSTYLSHTAELAYQKGHRKYFGTITFRVDWTGLKTLTVPLEEFDATTIAKADATNYGIQFSDDYKTLIKVPDTLASYTIPVCVTTIGEKAFYFCRNLQSITIPESVTTIEEEAFHYCANLQSVTLSEGLITIGKEAFRACEALPSITLPEGVITIEESAFYGCEKLTSVTLPTTLKTIGGNAFTVCRNLASLKIPASVERIEYNTFTLCDNLTLTIDSRNQHYKIHQGVLFDKEMKTLYWAPSNITHYTVPSGVTTIGKKAFQFNGNLLSLSIPSSVQTIEAYAFDSCYKLKTITLSEGVTTIGEEAFSSSNIQSIVIPESVTTIKSDAFRYSDVQSITIKNKHCKLERNYNENDIFEECDELEDICVPQGFDTSQLNLMNRWKVDYLD